MASTWVQKFGGTSVGNIERIQYVAELIADAHQKGHRLIIVVSALNDETNRLLGLARELTNNPHPRECDALLATGEQVAASLLSICLQDKGIPACSYNGLQIPIHTTSEYTQASILHIDNEMLQAKLEQGIIPVVTGFQGCAQNGDTTTLGRGGSDLTAVAIAHAVQADECQIFTDVTGVYDCDPRIVPQASQLEMISMLAMLEMSRAGAQIIQYQAMQYAAQHATPIRVLSSFEASKGTFIYPEVDTKPVVAKIAELPYQHAIVGIALDLEVTVYIFTSCKGALLQQAAQWAAQIDAQHAQMDYVSVLDSAQQVCTHQCGFSLPQRKQHVVQALLQDFMTSHAVEASETCTHADWAKLSLITQDAQPTPQLKQQVLSCLAAAHIQVHALLQTQRGLSVWLSAQNSEHAARLLHYQLLSGKNN